MAPRYGWSLVARSRLSWPPHVKAFGPADSKAAQKLEVILGGGIRLPGHELLSFAWSALAPKASQFPDSPFSDTPLTALGYKIICLMVGYHNSQKYPDISTDDLSKSKPSDSVLAAMGIEMGLDAIVCSADATSQKQLTEWKVHVLTTKRKELACANARNEPLRRRFSYVTMGPPSHLMLVLCGCGKKSSQEPCSCSAKTSILEPYSSASRPG
ncbi:hypothetical protein BOTBODRAFT_582120 [Botryobasidium botryosum FD-172 SS1]|uniref:Uncharacterized protein n=1 Tax=Botryobasidium botryosum (strain FD-172 SS1) TaxID=930990 RepID=A0A067MPS4_BOTB1|nr:hypothetical protein BOTBODRAFT_582120 [Botryobasidium botryosum FD-172 SS1]